MSQPDRPYLERHRSASRSLLAPVVRQAEELGLAGLFATQVHGAPFSTLAAAAMVTERVQLGTGIAIAATRSPVRDRHDGDGSGSDLGGTPRARPRRQYHLVNGRHVRSGEREAARPAQRNRARRPDHRGACPRGPRALRGRVYRADFRVPAHGAAGPRPDPDLDGGPARAGGAGGGQAFGWTDRPPHVVDPLGRAARPVRARRGTREVRPQPRGHPREPVGLDGRRRRPATGHRGRTGDCRLLCGAGPVPAVLRGPRVWGRGPQAERADSAGRPGRGGEAGSRRDGADLRGLRQRRRRARPPGASVAGGRLHLSGAATLGLGLEVTIGYQARIAKLIAEESRCSDARSGSTWAGRSRMSSSRGRSGPST